MLMLKRIPEELITWSPDSADPLLIPTLPPSCPFSLLLRGQWIQRGELCLTFAWELVPSIPSNPSLEDMEAFEE